MQDLAIVFDDLIQFGGAERLLLAVTELWPHAPVYTSVASKNWQSLCKSKNIKLVTSFMKYLPFKEKLNRFYSPLLAHILAFESFDFSEFKVVLSISARYAHMITTKPGTKHVCYMNTPGRPFWEPFNYFENERLKSGLLNMSLSHIRQADFTAAQRVDTFIANSHVPKARIKKYYRRDAAVIFPFVDTAIYEKLQPEEGGYFLVITRLIPWKKVHIAVEACEKQNLKLIVVGEGPDSVRLKKLSNGTTTFLGFVSDQKKKEVLSGCTALIQTQYEDFGIAPLEALACGKPVIAYGKGGVLEIVEEGKTGEFFSAQNSESLAAVLRGFKATAYSQFDCRLRAKSFDKMIFQKWLKSYIVNMIYS